MLTVREAVEELNRNHALVLAGGKAVVMRFEEKSNFTLLSAASFRLLHLNKLIQIGEKFTTAGEVWLRDRERREYAGIEFAPGGGRPEYYNLFKGFAADPREGNCSRFLAHLKDNVAQGDDKLFTWIVGWFAAIFQRPDDKTGTSLVLRGKQGVGKTIVGKIVGDLLGDHYALVSDPRYVTGQFNSHMVSILLLHADEAFWAGDRRAEGLLKDLVTGSAHFIEYKGIDPIRVANYVRLFVTGNQDWLVPAGLAERRFAVFDVGEDHIQDHAYFAAIDEQMRGGGREAPLHYFLNFNLSQVNLRVVPRTAPLLEQQIASFTPEQSWWFDTLRRGELPSMSNHPNVCLKRWLFRRYLEHAKQRGVTRRSAETSIGMFLAKYVPKLDGKAKITYQDYNGTVTKRGWGYAFPSLRECREAFAHLIQQDVDWGDPEKWPNEDWRREDETLRPPTDPEEGELPFD